MPVWSRLIRFESTDGRLLRGEPILPSPDFDVGSTIEATKLQAKVIEGQDIYDTTGKTKVTDEIVTVKKLLGPLAQEDVPIVRCIGLNFLKHSTYIWVSKIFQNLRGISFSYAPTYPLLWYFLLMWCANYRRKVTQEFDSYILWLHSNMIKF